MLTFSLSAIEPQSGKDTFANLLKECYESKGLTVRVTAFGDDLRQHVAGMFKYEDFQQTLQNLNSPSKDVPMAKYSVNCLSSGFQNYASFLLKEGVDKFADLSLRFHMQHYGTDFIREFIGLDYLWLEAVTDRLAQWEVEEVDIVIVTDTRFPLEFQALKDKFDARFIKIEPKGFPETAYKKEGRAQHKAESYSGSFEYDITIQNEYGFPERMLGQLYTLYSKPL